MFKLYFQSKDKFYHRIWVWNLNSNDRGKYKSEKRKRRIKKMNEQEIMAEVEDYGRQIFEAISYANEGSVAKF